MSLLKMKWGGSERLIKLNPTKVLFWTDFSDFDIDTLTDHPKVGNEYKFDMNHLDGRQSLSKEIINDLPALLFLNSSTSSTSYYYATNSNLYSFENCKKVKITIKESYVKYDPSSFGKNYWGSMNDVYLGYGVNPFPTVCFNEWGGERGIGITSRTPYISKASDVTINPTWSEAGRGYGLFRKGMYLTRTPTLYESTTIIDLENNVCEAYLNNEFYVSSEFMSDQFNGQLMISGAYCKIYFHGIKVEKLE